jgi:hypothetical protein
MKVTSAGKLITPIIQKYLDIINSGIIEESQIISMKSLMNDNKDARQLIFEALHETEGLRLTESQNIKGYSFLMNQCKTPRGIERKNNPFGYREQAALEEFSHFELVDFYDAGNKNHSFYLPVYDVVTKGNGYGFQYYYNGKVNVIG